MAKKKTKPYLKGFHRIKTPVMLNGVYVKDDGSELIVQFAYGEKHLHFRPLKEKELSL